MTLEEKGMALGKRGMARRHANGAGETLFKVSEHINFNLPPLMKVLTEFHLINEISRAFFFF